MEYKAGQKLGYPLCIQYVQCFIHSYRLCSCNSRFIMHCIHFNNVQQYDTILFNTCPKWQCAEKFNSIHYSILPQFILICMIFEAFTIIIIVLKNISGQGETLTRACNKMPLELTKKRCTWYLTVRKSATILNSLRLVL